MVRQQVAEILAGAEQLQQDFQAPPPAFGSRRQLRSPGRIGEKAFQIVQRHVRVGAANEKSAQQRAQIAEMPRPMVSAMCVRFRQPRSESLTLH